MRSRTAFSRILMLESWLAPAPGSRSQPRREGPRGSGTAPAAILNLVNSRQNMHLSEPSVAGASLRKEGSELAGSDQLLDVLVEETR
jgi:hypothetical protein